MVHKYNRGKHSDRREKMYVANIIVTNLVAFAVRPVIEDLITRQKKKKIFFSTEDKCESFENHQKGIKKKHKEVCCINPVVESVCIPSS